MTDDTTGADDQARPVSPTEREQPTRPIPLPLHPGAQVPPVPQPAAAEQPPAPVEPPTAAEPPAAVEPPPSVPQPPKPEQQPTQPPMPAYLRPQQPAPTQPPAPPQQPAPTQPPAYAQPPQPSYPQTQPPAYGQPPQPPQPPAYTQPQQPPAYAQPQPAYAQPQQPAFAQPQHPVQPPQYTAAQPGFPPTQPPQKRGLGTGAILGIVGGGLAVVIAIIVVIVIVVSSLGSHASAGPTSGGEAPVPAAKPADAVTGFLDAIAKGDSKTAISFLDTKPTDTTLLTDDVLAASNAIAPITAVTVTGGDSDSYSGEVSASYQLGDTPVTTEYYVSQGNDKKWKIVGDLGSISTSAFDGLGLTINGQAVKGDRVAAFPGSYQLATTLPNFTLTGDATVTVTDQYDSADTSGITPALSDAGAAQFQALVKAAVDACVASTTLAAGCGLDLPATLSDGTTLVDGTIQRTLDSDAAATLASLKSTLSYDNPTLAQGEYIGSVDVTAQVTTADGQSGTGNVIFAPSLGTPSVDMASATPTVTWD